MSINVTLTLAANISSGGLCLVPKKTIFLRSDASRKTRHSFLLYNERCKKFENGLGVGVGLAYGAK